MVAYADPFTLVSDYAMHKRSITYAQMQCLVFNEVRVARCGVCAR